MRCHIGVETSHTSAAKIHIFFHPPKKVFFFVCACAGYDSEKIKFMMPQLRGAGGIPKISENGEKNPKTSFSASLVILISQIVKDFNTQIFDT